MFDRNGEPRYIHVDLMRARAHTVPTHYREGTDQESAINDGELDGDTDGSEEWKIRRGNALPNARIYVLTPRITYRWVTLSAYTRRICMVNMTSIHDVLEDVQVPCLSEDK